jgi:uncharacterized protein (DUF1330 family)
MSAFYIITHTVTDPQKFVEEYLPGVMPFLMKYGAEVVVADMQAKPVQGEPAKGVAVLRFPSEQAIRDWLSDPGYQSVKQIRLGITVNASAVIAVESGTPG